MASDGIGHGGLTAGLCALALALPTACTGGGTPVTPAPDVIEHSTAATDVAEAPPEPRAAVPVSAKETEMEELLRDLTAHPELEVRITVGTEYFATGQFTLAMAGSGKARVNQKMSGQVKDTEKDFSTDATAAFGKLMADNRLAAARTSTLPREPGDTQVKIEIARNNAPVFEVVIWNADRFDDPQLQVILKETERLLQDITGIPPF